ncbi:hypothetical protein AB0L65_55700 [Nonomuraea sp. NPDC052116]
MRNGLSWRQAQMLCGQAVVVVLAFLQTKASIKMTADILRGSGGQGPGPV